MRKILKVSEIWTQDLSLVTPYICSSTNYIISSIQNIVALENIWRVGKIWGTTMCVFLDNKYVFLDNRCVILDNIRGLLDNKMALRIQFPPLFQYTWLRFMALHPPFFSLVHLHIILRDKLVARVDRMTNGFTTSIILWQHLIYYLHIKNISFLFHHDFTKK